ncbi:MAG TPA: lectin-like protein [Pirellulales bacterium]|jgi:hypothetical protein
MFKSVPVFLALSAVIYCAATQPSSAGVIPISPVISDPATGHSYQLLSNANWADSEAEAEALGGHLATIGNQEQQNFLLDVFGGYGGQQHLLWIGLYDPTQQINAANPADNYLWVSGAPITYTNWDSGEPNNAFGTEFWVAMYYPNFHNPGAWNDWSNQTLDPIGIPFNGVVEFVPEPASITTAVVLAVGGLLAYRGRGSSTTRTQ